MTEQEQKTGICLEPDYTEKFLCDGQRCKARCCHHWGIYVDEAAYGRYLALPAEERDWVLSHLAETSAQERSRGPLYRAKPRFDETEGCTMLGEDCLCRLQLRLGEKYLGDVCALYPRHIVQVGPYLEKALSLSCPLAAELALLRSDLPRLVERELPLRRRAAWKQTACGEGEDGVAEAFRILQLTCWQILSRQELSLGGRLRVFLAYLDEADAAVAEGDLEALLGLQERYEGVKPPGPEQRQHKGLLPPEALESLKAALAPIEAQNRHTAGIEPLPTPLPLPLKEQLLDNYVLAEFYIGLYPCRLGGTLRHNGEVVCALAALAETAIAPGVAEGDAKEVLSACVRLSTLANHDQDWLEALSEWVEKSTILL